MTPATIMLALLAATLISVPWAVVVDRLVRAHEAMDDDLTDVENQLEELTDLLHGYFVANRGPRGDWARGDAARVAHERLIGAGLEEEVGNVA